MILCNAETGRKTTIPSPATQNRHKGLKLAKALKDDPTPKVLTFDIETSPNLAYVWQCYKTNVSPAMMHTLGDVMCYAAKLLGSDMIYFDSRQRDKDDKRMCETLWKLVDGADIVIAHNGKAFDVKLMNARWAFHGLPPPSPYKVVDTLKVVKDSFRIPINKLDFLGRYFNIGKKMEHEGFNLWTKCMAGNRAAWNRMRDYNLQDVFLTEELYLKIRPWDRRHPNIALCYEDDLTRCVCCGGTKFIPLPKRAKTAVSLFPAMRCKSCGKPMRSGKRIKSDKIILRNTL